MEDMGPEFPRRWTAAGLAELMGTSRSLALTSTIPSLVRRGVLRKAGKGWIGVHSHVVAALLGGE